MISHHLDDDALWGYAPHGYDMLHLPELLAKSLYIITLV